MKATFVFLVSSFLGVLCYSPSEKENLLYGLLFRGLIDRINDNSAGDVSFLDLTDGLPIDSRVLTRDLEDEQVFPLDYESLGDVNMYPSIRDQEYMQHSSLWGNQYISGGTGDGNQIIAHGLKVNQQEVKSDASLPAYCNPPNPCPIDYSSEQGCLENFENTSSFSRSFQALQECMCDTEHMFDCTNSNEQFLQNPLNVARIDVDRLLQQSLKNSNPYLLGEKLPVAAKKGNNMY